MKVFRDARFSRPFYMSEVTIEQYEKFKADYPGYEDYAPYAAAISWHDAAIYVRVDGAGATSELFASGNNGCTWVDTAGTTTRRHSAFVLLNGNTILAYGGKNVDMEGFMPKNISTDFGRTWQVGKSPVSRLGGGQRPAH